MADENARSSNEKIRQPLDLSPYAPLEAKPTKTDSLEQQGTIVGAQSPKQKTIRPIKPAEIENNSFRRRGKLACLFCRQARLKAIFSFPFAKADLIS
jgi:hypothetical protein